jgi:CBS domain-containing protein
VLEKQGPPEQESSDFFVQHSNLSPLTCTCFSLPVLSNEGRVEGLITARDMSDFGLSAKDKGGKKAYLNDVSERVGLSSDTSMAEPPTYLQAHLALEQEPVFVNIGVAELPHPFKSVEGCASNLAGESYC